MIAAIDLDMLANDIGDLLAKHHNLDATDDDIRPHLDDFVAKIQASINARPDNELGASDMATWTPSDNTEEPAAQRSRRPHMTYLPWCKSQLVMLGATARDEHYWQCPTTGCKVWAGPYGDPITAKKAGFEHIYRCEKTDYFRRGRQS